MELRHLRYFVAVAEELGFARAAGALTARNPALSKQPHDAEIKWGAAWLNRAPPGVRLAGPGEAVFTEARNTLDGAARAIASARGASEDRASTLHFAHGELSLYAATIEGLLATFRDASPGVQVRVSSQTDGETYRALRERTVDVASVFLAQWPVAGFGAHRLIDCATTGVLLPASHPLAAQPSVRLPDLQALPWLQSASLRWPGFLQVFEEALQDRGLRPQRRRERPKEAPSHNLLIAAGEAWALASEAIAAPYRTGSQAIVHRPFVEPPIPCWLALVWLPEAAAAVQRLVEVARRSGLAGGDADGTKQTARRGEALGPRSPPPPTTRAIAARRPSPPTPTPIGLARPASAPP